MKLSEEEIAAIARKIGERLRPAQIVLFGSYAQGTATEDSDVDLLVVMESDEPAYKRSAAVRELLWPPPASMDILVYTPREVARWRDVTNHIITHALQTGKVLYAA